MESFMEWCLRKNQKSLISEEQMTEIAERIAGRERLDSYDVEDLTRDYLPEAVKKQMQQNPEYQKLQNELMNSNNPITQNELRETVTERLENKLDSNLDYKNSKNFEDFEKNLEKQVQQIIEKSSNDKGDSSHYDYHDSKIQSLKSKAKELGGAEQLAKEMVRYSVSEVTQQMLRDQTQEIKNQIKKDLKERFVGELKGYNLFRSVSDDSYEVNQLELMEVLGKKAFKEAMEVISSKRKSVKRGAHKSKLEQNNGFSAIYRKTDIVSSGLAVLPTMQNSMTRRAVDRTGPLLHEDDLTAYESEKKVSYAVEFLVDANKCITKDVSGTKKTALSLYYMMKKYYPHDTYEFIKFNDNAEVIKLDELLTMQLGGCRDSEKAVDLGIERLEKHKNKQKVMYLISDGNPCGWGKGYERRSGLIEKAKKLKEKDIQLVMISLDGERDSFHEFSEEVAKEAGGLVYHVPDAEKLATYTLKSFRDLKKSK